MISQDLRFEVLQLYREGHPGYTPNKFSLVKGLDLVLANLENPEVFNYVGVNRLGSSKKSFDYALKPETKQDQITVEQYAAFSIRKSILFAALTYRVMGVLIPCLLTICRV